MADNELDLFEWQIGLQSVFATAVAPTAKLMGITGGSFKPNIKGSCVEEQRGDLTPTFATTPDSAMPDGEIEFEACFEDLCFWLDSFFALATPTGTDPYTRVHTGAGAKPVSRMNTIVRGGATYAKALVGAYASTLEITGETNTRLTGKVGLIGHSVADDALESLADRAVNFMHGNQTKIYVDAFGGSFGSTEVTGQKHSFGLSINANKSHKMGLGSISPSEIGQQKGDGGSNQLKISLAIDTQSAAFYALQLTTTMAQGLWRPLIRIENEVSANLKWTIDYAGWSEDVPEWIVDQDGIASLEFTLNPLYDASLGSWMESTIINGVATLP